MGKKTLSKPMKEILSRLNEFEYIETMIFPEDIIVNVSKVLLFTPPRTPRISRLKSQILKPTFLS